MSDENTKIESESDVEYLISIVIPLYNKAPYIARALRSVLAQEWKNYEIIIVDDCSTDPGVSIAQGVLSESKQPYRIVRRKKRGGSCAPARATGVRYARGQYVAFLDADDEWNKGFLTEITHLIRDFPEAEAFAVERELYINGRVDPGPYREKSGVRESHSIDLEGYLNARAKYGNPFRVQGMAFAPEALDDIGGFVHAPRSSDIDLMFRFFLANKVAAWSPYIGLVIHRVPDSTMANTPTQVTRPWFYTINQAIDRGGLPKSVNIKLRKDLQKRKVQDVIQAVKHGCLSWQYLNNMKLYARPVFSVFAVMLILIRPLQIKQSAFALLIIDRLRRSLNDRI